MEVHTAQQLDEVELVDEWGNPIGTMDRARVHSENTPRHRAFSLYLTDGDGRVLITRRALSKRTWPGVWTNACCGHPRPGEADEDAITRRVRDELGIEIADLQPLLPDFSYRATDASGIQEFEVCPVYRARVADSDQLQPDPDETVECSWVSWDALTATVSATPCVLSPWTVEQITSMVERGLSATDTAPTDAAPTDAAPTDTAPTDAAHASSVQASSVQATELPPLERTLAATERHLNDNVAGLQTLWRQLGADDERVLALDLPAWLGSLIGTGGKRLRPILCHWGFVAAGGTAPGDDYDTLVEAAAALELLHEFALIHDDVMDESAIRRGRPAAHRQASSWHEAASGRGDAETFGRNLAILLGDLALVQAFRVGDRWPDVLRDSWHELCVELVLGQRGDLTGAAAGRRDKAHAERISALKSAAYTVIRPLEIGALAAGASDHLQRTLREYGVHAGAAFALRDDILGIWGDPAVTGKPAGDDLREAKPTVVLAMAAERLTGPAARALRRVGTSEARDRDVTLLQEAMVEAGVLAEVESTISRHVEAATDALDSPVIAPAAVAGLRGVAAAMAWRQR